uniref:ATP synthase subunit a n=2 Tax=Hydra vulgaris TaxID=6087 RepID=A0A0H5ANR1_HYDVU|nr:ATP synthase F0 subunit 6 [Hydra vulgaris]BAR90834.1 ATP synthase F0 subunit 6 [Hydra vulgaris]BAR90839.1 ATP synthase F0 subunit 6 [Hydra vulgaris]
MSSYFDHFLIIKIFGFLFDSHLILILSIFIIFVALNFTFIIPSRIQLFFEMIINHFFQIVKENLGNNSQIYVLFLSTLFFYLLSINLLGFFIFTLPPTTHISLTFGLSFFIWLSIIVFGFFNFKSSYLSMFMPTGAPLGFSPLLVFIELASHISRPIALGMRLAANLTAGHILLAILSDFIFKMICFSSSFFNLFPLMIIIFMIILEIGVLIIQAYVFTLLCLIYLKDSLILH